MEVIALISCIFLTFLILNSIVYAVDKPTVFDHNLKLDIEYQGNDDPKLRENQLSAVTQFGFLGDHDILLLNKNDGKYIRILDHYIIIRTIIRR